MSKQCTNWFGIKAISNINMHSFVRVINKYSHVQHLSSKVNSMAGSKNKIGDSNKSKISDK